jgi:hypothetical protein
MSPGDVPFFQPAMKTEDPGSGFKPMNCRNRSRQRLTNLLRSFHADGETVAGLLVPAPLPSRAEVYGVEERIVRWLLGRITASCRTISPSLALLFSWAT